jgi:membrane fusion protein (multidrug efflux system)
MMMYEAELERGGEALLAEGRKNHQADEQESLRQEVAILREEVQRLRERQEALQQHALQQAPSVITQDGEFGVDGQGHHEPKHDEPPDAEPRRRTGRIILRAAIAAVVMALLAVGSDHLWQYVSSYETTDDAQIDGHLNSVSSRINGTVIGVYVDDTQYVKAGQLIVALDPRDYTVAVERARADLKQAQAQVELAKANYQTATAKLRASQATSVKANRDVQRYEELFNRRVISRDQYEEQIRVGQVDAATVEADRATAASVEKDVASKEAAVQSAKAALDQAVLNLSYTKIYAPVSGVVGKKTVEMGHRIEPGQQLMAIVQLDDIWVTANFKETQIRKMRVGQPTTIYVDALGRDFKGYVEGLPGASGEKYSLLPPENATGNYVKVVQRLPVRIRFDKGQDPDHRLRPGMSVEPTVWLR